MGVTCKKTVENKTLRCHDVEILTLMHKKINILYIYILLDNIPHLVVNNNI